MRCWSLISYIRVHNVVCTVENAWLLSGSISLTNVTFLSILSCKYHLTSPAPSYLASLFLTSAQDHYFLFYYIIPEVSAKSHYSKNQCLVCSTLVIIEYSHWMHLASSNVSIRCDWCGRNVNKIWWFWGTAAWPWKARIGLNFACIWVLLSLQSYAIHCINLFCTCGYLCSKWCLGFKIHWWRILPWGPWILC